MFEELKNSASKITMSDQTKEKIIENCYSKTIKGEEYIMKNNVFGMKKVLIVSAVIMAVCVVSAGAIISHVRGFRDITKNGAVIGTEFYEETDMISLNTIVDGAKLLISASVANYDTPPYSEADEFKIGNYIIVDESGNILEKNIGETKAKSGFSDGTAEFEISIDSLQAGKYTFIINDFVISSKADQPLHVNGKWACEFSK